MCGIVGIYTVKGSHPRLPTSILSHLHHRGPDHAASRHFDHLATDRVAALLKQRNVSAPYRFMLYKLILFSLWHKRVCG